MLKLGEILFKYRDYTPIPFIIIMVIYAKADCLSWMIGGGLMLVGELIRVHGVAYIGGVSRTRSYSLGDKVVTGGPFSRCRNPLYVGNLLLSAGLIVASNVSHYFTLAFVVTFFLQYIPVVAWEENNLTNKFGDQYLEFKKAIPRWIPLLIPRKVGHQEEVKGEYKKAIRSERDTLISVVILIGLILWRSGALDAYLG